MTVLIVTICCLIDLLMSHFTHMCGCRQRSLLGASCLCFSKVTQALNQFQPSDPPFQHVSWNTHRHTHSTELIILLIFYAVSHFFFFFFLFLEERPPTLFLVYYCGCCSSPFTVVLFCSLFGFAWYASFHFKMQNFCYIYAATSTLTRQFRTPTIETFGDTVGPTVV